MSGERPTDIFEPVERKSLTQRMKDTFKESPAMVGGLGCAVGVLGYMLYGLKNRDPGQKLSVYLIHTRLAVQGTVIGALSMGMIYQMYR